MKDKTVVVIGGGNSGMNATLDLIPYAKEIIILEMLPELKGDPVLIDRIEKEKHVKILNNIKVEEILGDKVVSGIKYKNLSNGEDENLECDAIFVEIGYKPNSDIFKNLVDINKKGEIEVDHQSQKTSCDGVWAAGDITDSLYNQINTAIGDGIKAALNIYDNLKNK